MKYTLSRSLILIWCLYFSNNCLVAAIQDETTSALIETVAPADQEIATVNNQLVRVNYTDKPIAEAVNEVAAQLGVNIILPQDGKGLDKIFYESKITYHLPEKLSLKELWELLLVSLHTLGYMTHQQGEMLAISAYPNAKEAARQPLTLFHDVPPSDLPDTDQIIRYIYHLRNLSLDVNKTSIESILNSVLSKTPSYQLLNQTNAIIITDKAANIKGAMTIIAELDEGGLRDAIEVIPLYYASAELVDDLFNKQLFLDQQKKLGTKPDEKQVPYFPQNTKVAKLGRSNSIVIMGTTRSIDIVKDFIVKYIDRPLETGDSMLHVYDLQYLKATDFAKVLQNVVKGSQSQNQQTKGAVITGPHQYFEDVVIIAEISTKEEALTPETEITQVIKEASTAQKGPIVQMGGNRLIIAARKNDWVRIKRLIDELDKPQLQVAIEVLILDVRMELDRILGTQTRNKAGFNNSTANSINFQTAHLGKPVLKTDEAGNLLPDALMANLLKLTSTDPAGNLASDSPGGSFLVSFQDSNNLGVWSVLQVLNQFTNSSILAQPFLVTQNHKQAWVFTEENRYRVAETQGGTGQIARVNREDITAGITLDLLPHISETGNINMQIIVQINQFISSADNKFNRVIRTNANIGNGEVLVLGGLTRDEESVSISESPLLGQVPVLGWFFKRKIKVHNKNHLIVLISPTIVTPYVQGGMDTFTQGKMDMARENISEDLGFSNNRDPITRWFFKPNLDCPYQELDKYLDQTYYDEEADGATENIDEQKPLPVVAQKQQTAKSPEPPAQEKLKQLVKNEDNPLLIKQRKDQSIFDT